MIHNSFPCVAPLRCWSCSPCTIVWSYPLAKLIILTSSRLFGTPVDFTHKNRLSVNHRHLFLEITNECLMVIAVVACSIPSRIYMHSITIVIIANRIGSIVLILRLIACTRNPNDTLKTISTYDINYRLKIVTHSCWRTLSISILNMYRLLCKFKRNYTTMLLQPWVLWYYIPHGLEIVLIIITHLQFLRTHPGRADNNIKPMIECLLSNRQIECVKIFLQARGAKTRNIILSSSICRLLVRVISPTWLKMQSENVAIGTRWCFSNSSK